jgi:hypothetical protein
VNDLQRKVLITVSAVVLCMLLFPPFENDHIGWSKGYAFILEPPYQSSLDVITLIVQWLGVLIVGAIAFFIAKDK